MHGVAGAITSCYRPRVADEPVDARDRARQFPVGACSRVVGVRPYGYGCRRVLPGLQAGAAPLVGLQVGQWSPHPRRAVRRRRARSPTAAGAAPRLAARRARGAEARGAEARGAEARGAGVWLWASHRPPLSRLSRCRPSLLSSPPPLSRPSHVAPAMCPGCQLTCTSRAATAGGHARLRRAHACTCTLSCAQDARARARVHKPPVRAHAGAHTCKCLSAVPSSEGV